MAEFVAFLVGIGCGAFAMYIFLGFEGYLDSDDGEQ